MGLKKAEFDISKYKNIYVMSDIHGHYNEFLEMLKLIDFKDDDLLIVNGDMVDRGYDNIELLEHCFHYDNIITLMGNHEDMMTSIITTEIDVFNCWMKNGGKKTYNELMDINKEFESRYKLILAQVLNMPHYAEIDINDKKYLIIHAGIRTFKALNESSSIENIMAMQGTDSALWIRNEFLKKKYEMPFTVIFGHTPTYIIDYEINNNYPDYYDTTNYDREKIIKDVSASKIWHGISKIGIDCGLYSGGKLGCLRLNDMKEFYVDKISGLIE